MFTTSQHWKFFAEFCELELKSGGPDPQLALVNAMSLLESEQERVWRAGCYIAVYNVAYAEVLWRKWSWNIIKRLSQEQLELELKAYWSNVTTRVERRCVRRPDWMAEFLIGYRKFAQEYQNLKSRCSPLSPEEGYLLAWDVALKVPRLGRYVALKLLEWLRRYEGLEISPPDIRPKGGWSPRAALASLWELPNVAAKDDKPETLKLVNEVCKKTLVRLNKEYGVKLDLFQLQVMLCEYRESWEGLRQYPGRSLDSELKYAHKAEREVGHKSDIWKTRKKLFPEKHLGEVSGWEGPREGPASVLAKYHYTWSDLRYNFNQTHDFAYPTFWGQKPRLQALSLSNFGVARNKLAKPKSVRVYSVIEGVLFQSGRWTIVDEVACKELVKQYGLTGIANFWRDDPRLSKVVPWYRFWPLPDGRVVPPVVTEMAEEIHTQLKAGGRILTMCYGGRNRSGLLSALSVKLWYGCSGAEAVKIVKAARKGALINPYFVNYLTDGPVVGRLF